MKVAMVLSGCGHQDGAEIREAVLALLYLDKQGAEVEIFAPDTEQPTVINHLTGKPMHEKRNVMVEAARIARGKVKDLVQAKAENFDALVLPGGFGAAKNLSNFAERGKDCAVLPEFQRLVQQFYQQGKPIGAICISPAVLVAALRGVTAPTVTIGEDEGCANAIVAMGGKHQDCATHEIATDKANRVVSCSAYMRDDRLSAIAEGIEKLVSALLQMARQPQRSAA